MKNVGQGAALGLPCSTAVKANGFVLILATPPVDMVTGEMVRGVNSGFYNAISRSMPGISA
ncbi:hypothetical protein [Mesorhizobium sp. B2-4-12]|uniref:hypothetical protein n=1 Tax=Mesorhizobium sp. B2-4-12 TaxID=2589937 RepID=UPI001FEDB016|nr:hypothetical protein [Mesorhizobium sp. B2-4-12]